MIQTVCWTLLGIPVGYVISILIEHTHKLFYNKIMSKFYKYGIIIIIIFFSFLRGYTENDLVTNILNLLNIN